MHGAGPLTQVSSTFREDDGHPWLLPGLYAASRGPVAKAEPGTDWASLHSGPMLDGDTGEEADNPHTLYTRWLVRLLDDRDLMIKGYYRHQFRGPLNSGSSSQPAPMTAITSRQSCRH